MPIVSKIWQILLWLQNAILFGSDHGKSTTAPNSIDESQIHNLRIKSDAEEGRLKDSSP